MPKILPKTAKLPYEVELISADPEEYARRLNEALQRALDDVYGAFHYLADVGDWESADEGGWGALGLVTISSVPDGYDHKICVCDGTGWDGGDQGRGQYRIGRP